MYAIERCDALENALLRRIGEMYSEAMVDAIRRKKSFLQKQLYSDFMALDMDALTG